jgi:cytochrome c-type biogenesis protein CcsB
MSDIQLVLTNTAGVSSVASFWVFVASNAFEKWRKPILQLASMVLALGFAALTMTIIFRGFEAQRFPLSNLYESLLWFAWATMGGYLYLNRLYTIGQLGWLASLIAASIFLYGSWLPASQFEMAPLVPALVSYWRQIHVPPLIVSYAMFIFGGGMSLSQLWFSGRRLSMLLAVAAVACACLAVTLGTYTPIDTIWLQILFVGGSLIGVTSAWLKLNVIKSPNSENKSELYDDVSYRCVRIGFPLLTIGIITGGLWANHAWGSYWSWDPKESMSLVTWLSYAIYIHLRIHREISAEKLALVSVAGLLLVV